VFLYKQVCKIQVQKKVLKDFIVLIITFNAMLDILQIANHARFISNWTQTRAEF
jgi:hypothetical protein